MTFYYLDASAWVKRYLVEAGSTWVQKLFEQREPFSCSALGYIEVLAALARQQGMREIASSRRESLLKDLRADWNEMLQIQLQPDMLTQAEDFAWRHRLRGADAIHLAAACWLNESLRASSHSLILISSDLELIQAAQEVHLPVTNPAERR